MPRMLFDDTRKTRRLELVLLLFFPLGFNEDRKASHYSRTSNLRRGIVVIGARIISACSEDLRVVYRWFTGRLYGDQGPELVYGTTEGPELVYGTTEGPEPVYGTTEGPEPVYGATENLELQKDGGPRKYRS